MMCALIIRYFLYVGKPVRPMLDLILSRHIETMKEMLPVEEVKRLSESFAKDMNGLEDILRAGTLTVVLLIL